jgi:hypothetical protein
MTDRLWFKHCSPSKALAGATSKQNCHVQTGFHWFVVEEAFETYVVPLAQHSPKQSFKYFTAGLKWIHKGMTSRQMSSDIGMTDSTFRANVYPLFHHLARTMDVVRWADRLHPLNHTANFPYYTTTVVDTAPIAVSESRSQAFSRLLYAPKYGTTCLKLEVTCSLMGHIVDYKFPAGLGTTPDSTIHNRRVRTGEKQYLPWELTLGDGAYRQCPHILAKYPSNTNYLYDPRSGKRDVVVALFPYQQAHNQRLNHDRQRIEHIVGLINKKHKLLTLKWQGEYTPLIDAVNVVCELTQLQIMRASKNGSQHNGFSRYTDNIGPWAHDTPDHVHLARW